jgi:deltex
MKRTRRNILDNDDNEIGEKNQDVGKKRGKGKIMKDNLNSSSKISNGDNNLNIVTDSEIKLSCISDKNNNIQSNQINKSNNLSNCELTNIEFQKLIEKIKLNLKNDKFENKPEYVNKSYDISDQYLSKISNITKFKLISPIEIYYKIKYEEFNKHSLEEDKCTICLFHFYDEDLKSKSLEEIEKMTNENKDNFEAVLLENCSDHFFHAECLANLIGVKSHAKCPNCSKIYGIITGDQPKGTMKAYVTKEYHCDGYPKIGTIVIEYKFPSGKGYSGTHRIVYLPNNQEGKEILALLKVGFDRKLLFTIGTSVTTGQDNTTIWNGVHQKTNISGGSHNYGYPDPTYFNRVKQELAAKGVIQENINETLEDIANGFLVDTSDKKKKKK